MREIQLDQVDQSGVAPRLTFCAYGPTRSGKTTLAAGFPRPAFLSDVTESGYESLRGIGDEYLFEAGVKPLVFGIEKMNDMALARAILEQHIRSGMIQTIVIDSLTFYADLFLNFTFEMMGANVNNLKAYGQLGVHLRDLRVKWHQMGCNIVWLCLAQDPDEDRPNGLPMIPGKEAGKFGASCDYLFYLRHDRFKQGQAFVENYEIHSQPFGKYIAGVRRSDGVPEIPSPMLNATYSDILRTMGYDPDVTRKALPAYVRPKIVVPSVASAPAAPAVSAAPAGARAPTAPAAARHVPNAAKPHTPTAAPRPAAAPTVTRRPAMPAGPRPGNNS